jgi:hypothetical protein
MGTTAVLLLANIPLLKTNCEMVRCPVATVSSFVAKVRGEVFADIHAAAVNRYGMRN